MQRLAHVGAEIERRQVKTDLHPSACVLFKQLLFLLSMATRQVHQLLRHEKQSDGSHSRLVGGASPGNERRYGFAEHLQGNGTAGRGGRFGTGCRRTVDVDPNRYNNQCLSH